MKYQYPDSSKGYTFLQTNRSDDLGSIWSSFNLDFQSNLGATRLAQKLVTSTTSADDADLGCPTAFELFDGRWWSICGARVFKNSSLLLIGSYSEDASTGAQTNYGKEESDLALFNGLLWSTTTSGLYSKDANGGGTGTWTSRDSMTSSRFHGMTYFKKFNQLYYADTTTNISSIDTSYNVYNSPTTQAYCINLGSEVSSISAITSGSQFIWIGTCINSNSAQAYSTDAVIMQWDGITDQVTQEYKIQAGSVLAITVFNDVPYALDSEGRILKYTGYSFEEIQRLPINRTLLASATNTGDNAPTHFNGFIATKNNTLLVNVNNLNGDNTGTITENLPSGIWELDLSTLNFTHKYSPTLKAVGSSTITDYGQNRVSNAGAIKFNTASSESSSGRSTIAAGFTYYTDATTTASAIFLDSPVNRTTPTEGQKRGYFVTTWFNTKEVQDKFERLWDIHKRFLTSTDKIVYKYRLIEEDPIQATITWTSTTTFTTTTDVSAYAPTATGFNGTTGGEVEVLQGTGSGSCTHISSITENAGTYTVTLDTAVTGVTGTAKARFQKWIKLYPDVTGLVKSWESLAIGGSNTQIQIKCCMEFTGDMEFHRLAIFSNEDIKITQ